MSTRIPGAPTLQPLAIDIVSVQSQVVYGSVGNNLALPVIGDHDYGVYIDPAIVAMCRQCAEQLLPD